MKRIVMLAVLLSCGGIAGAEMNDDLSDNPEIAQMEKQIEELKSKLKKQTNKSLMAKGTTTVTGKGEGKGWNAALILGSSGAREAQKNAINDAYQKCDAMGGHLSDNVFKRDMFDDFWRSIGDDNKHVECSGWSVIAAGQDNCTAMVKLSCARN